VNTNYIKRNKLKKERCFLAFFVLAFLWAPNGLFSQGSCGASTITDAEKSYLVGKFGNTLNSLNGCLEREGFNIGQKENAYRILGWTYIALDSTLDARNAVKKLLNINPSYSIRTNDPLLFANMVYEIRYGIEEVLVTSVSKKPESIRETPSTVMVITEDDIKQRGYIDLEAMFSDLPGFDVSRIYGTTYSNIYQRGYRSNNTDRTLFMIDGVEESELWTNIAFLSRQYPVTNVKRVEVIYGPASTMYGANAFLGVINVITKEPADVLKGKDFAITGEIAGGNYETKYGDVTIASKIKNISFTTTARVFSSNEIDLSGFEEFDYNPNDYDNINYSSILNIANPDTSLLSSSQYYQIQGDSAILTTAGQEAARNYDKNNFLNPGANVPPLKFSNKSEHYFLSSKLKIGDVTFAYQYWKQMVSTGTYGNDNSRLGSDYGGIWAPSQAFMYAKYEGKISKDLTFTNMAQFRVNQVTDVSTAVTLINYSNGTLDLYDLADDKEPSWETTYFHQIAKQFRNELKLNYSPSRRFEIIGGVEIRNSTLQGDYRKLILPGIASAIDTTSVTEVGVSSLDTVPGGNNFTVYDFGIFLQGSYRLGTLARITLGSRFDHNQIRKSQGYGNIFNPRVAIVFTPGDAVVKLIYATAFKDAANFQKYATSPSRLLNNPALKPEKVTNYELSVGYRFNKRLFVDGSAYYSRYSEAIETKLTPYNNSSTLKLENLGFLKIYGFQTTAKYHVGDYTFYGNYTFVHPFSELLDDEGERADTLIRIGDIASHRINAGVNAVFNKVLNVNLRANFSSRRPVGPETTVDRNTLGDFPALFILSGAVSYTGFIPGLSAQLSVNNILNNDYSDPGLRSATGRFRPYRVPQRGAFAMFKLMFDL
jgi:outer membrane receptor for ferrienterochelin and colicins